MVTLLHEPLVEADKGIKLFKPCHYKRFHHDKFAHVRKR